MHKIENRVEQRLAKRLRNGENGAMQEFYTLYAEQLAGVCARYIVDKEDMKDVFQESLVKIVTHIYDFEYRGEGSLQAWATKVVVNESLKFLRMAKRQELLLMERDTTEEPAADEPQIEDIPPEVLHEMVGQLPTNYRTALNLYAFENKSHQEIAKLLGIKENSSTSLVRRAKDLLAKMIKEYNIKHHPR